MKNIIPTKLDKDTVIIVTGASSGIGMATVKLLAKKEVKLALVSRNIKILEDLSKEIPNSFVVTCDMTKAEDIIEMVRKVKEHFGRIDVLINNAGRGSTWENVENIDLKEFKDLLELNVIGPIIAMQEVIPIMRSQGNGSIINIGSGTVKMLREGGSVYPGTKVLLEHISKVARKELEKDNIFVSIIHPFITKTNFFKNIQGNEPALNSNLMSMADEPEKVADKIIEAIETGIFEIDMTKDKTIVSD